jgi:hypothetical protein
LPISYLIALTLIVFFIRYFIDLHFKYYSLSWFPLQNLLPPVLSPPPFPCSPTHPFLLTTPGIPIFWDIEHSQLPLMTEETILCYICSWSRESHQVNSLVGGLVPGSSGGYLLIHIVVPPMELQVPSAPSVLSLSSSSTEALGTLCSVQWLVESIHL